MAKRKTVAEIRQQERDSARKQMLAEVCRVLRHQLDQGEAADALWSAYQSGKPLRESGGGATWFAPFDRISF